MTGNTFNLTADFTNSSSNLQTFNESAALTTAVGNTFAVTGAGITISNGLNFTAGGVTTTGQRCGQLADPWFTHSPHCWRAHHPDVQWER